MSQQAIHNTAPAHEDAGAPASGWQDYLAAVSRHIALLAAWIALCGSLFFSEVLGWQPCLLCWYQRILMYPLAVILAVGILRRDRDMHLYALPLSVFGACVSLYHYLLIKTNWFEPPSCQVGVPCTVDYLDWFGFINIPFMALTAFLIITVMMVVWSMFQPIEDDDELLDDEAVEDAPAPRRGLDGARLAVPMIIVAVVLAFMVGSTFV